MVKMVIFRAKNEDEIVIAPDPEDNTVYVETKPNGVTFTASEIVSLIEHLKEVAEDLKKKTGEW